MASVPWEAQLHYQSIQILRGLAACAVVLAHIAPPRFVLGAIGVDIFFIVSGFVMASISSRRSAGQFLFDRAWRIYPTYLMLAVPWGVFALAIGVVSPDVFVNSLLLWPSWFGLDSTTIGVSWTLVYELGFYFAVAMAIFLKSAALPLSLFGIAVVARPFVDHPLIEFVGHPIALEFLLGWAVARAPKREPAGMVALALGLGWIAFFPNAQLHDFLGERSSTYGILRVLGWGFPSALIVYGLLCQEARLSGQWTRPFLMLGAASYSIYLIHTFATASVDLPVVLEFSFAVGAGLIFWRLVEQPMLAAQKRLRDGRQRYYPAVAPAVAD